MREEFTADFVLDCSVTMAWCYKYCDDILNSFGDKMAIVPTIWPLEVTNVLLVAEKRKRLSAIQSASFLDVLALLPIKVDTSTTLRAFNLITVSARKMGLTTYDASYLEIAVREQIPLATFDKQLKQAAKKIGVQLLSL